jgi:hypothetical protein
VRSHGASYKSALLIFKAAVLFCLAILTVSSGSHAETKTTKIGLLSCRVEGGSGYLIGSSKNVDCKFSPVTGRSERYTGTLGKFGLDVGATNDTVIVWAVFAPTKMKSGALKGSYRGISAEATAGLGLGANVLVGGFRKTINLQPLSVQAQTGLNIAIAVTSLSLRYDR